MSRILARATLALLVVAALGLRGDGAASGDAPRTVVLGVGDVMQVDGVPIGCQVNQRDERIVVECRRDGRLKGTYVSIFDTRHVRVARFRSRDEAAIVFEARHRGRARMCGAAAAHAGKRACR
jgi:hypothetical protein